MLSQGMHAKASKACQTYRLKAYDYGTWPMHAAASKAHDTCTCPIHAKASTAYYIRKPKASYSAYDTCNCPMHATASKNAQTQFELALSVPRSCRPAGPVRAMITIWPRPAPQ